MWQLLCFFVEYICLDLREVRTTFGKDGKSLQEVQERVSRFQVFYVLVHPNFHLKLKKKKNKQTSPSKQKQLTAFQSMVKLRKWQPDSREVGGGGVTFTEFIPTAGWEHIWREAAAGRLLSSTVLF